MDPNSPAKRIRVSIQNFRKQKKKIQSLQGTYLKHTEWLEVKEYKKINQANTISRKAGVALFIQGKTTLRKSITTDKEDYDLKDKKQL